MCSRFTASAPVLKAGGGGGGGGTTDLSIANRGADSLDIASSTGDDATVPSASATQAGLLSAADKTILDNAGGLLRFGTVDPTSTDGNDRDTWINTTDGSFWSKANGTWTKQFTFGPDLGDHTRRAAISTDTTLEQTEYDNGTTSVTQDITIPTWTGANRYVFVGVPEAEDDITDIEQNGVSVFGGFEAAPDFGSHKWWRTSAAPPRRISLPAA